MIDAGQHFKLVQICSLQTELNPKKISLSIASAYNWFGLQSFLWPPDIRREGGCGSSAWILMIITQSSPGWGLPNHDPARSYVRLGTENKVSAENIQSVISSATSFHCYRELVAAELWSVTSPSFYRLFI